MHTNRNNSGQIRTGQINAGRGAVVAHELRKIAEDLKLDVLYVQDGRNDSRHACDGEADLIWTSPYDNSDRTQ